jgi:hypothetical protein
MIHIDDPEKNNEQVRQHVEEQMKSSIGSFDDHCNSIHSGGMKVENENEVPYISY